MTKNEKLEQFRFELKQRLETCKGKRANLESVGDLRNSLPLLVKELELRDILDILAGYFPEPVNDFK